MKTRKLRIKRKVVVKSRKKGKLNRKISYRRKQKKSMVRRQKRNSRNNFKKKFSRKMRGGVFERIFGKGKREDSIPPQSGLEESQETFKQIRLKQEAELIDKTLKDATSILEDYNKFKDSPLGKVVYANRHELYADLETAVRDNVSQTEIQEKIDAILTPPPSE